jgi:hypothetical protein
MDGDGWVDVVLGLGTRSVDAERRVVLVRVGVRVGFVAVVRDLGEEDAIHGDHGDGGCPVLNGVSEALTMAVTTWTGGHVAEPPHHSKP